MCSISCGATVRRRHKWRDEAAESSARHCSVSGEAAIAVHHAVSCRLRRIDRTNRCQTFDLSLSFRSDSPPAGASRRYADFGTNESNNKTCQSRTLASSVHPISRPPVSFGPITFHHCAPIIHRIYPSISPTPSNDIATPESDSTVPCLRVSL